MKYKTMFSTHWSGVLVILFLLFVIGLTTINNFHPHQYTQHAAGLKTSRFAANIEYDGNNAAPYGTYQQASLTNPNIAGVDVVLDWTDVEPSQGVYNWTPMDNQITAWGQQGKKFVLLIRYIHQLNGSQSSCTNPQVQYLPSWEIARIPTLCRTGGAIIPNYFDPTFQTDLQSYITAIAQHLSHSQYLSNLAYMRIGIGEAGEDYPCLHCSTQDIQQLTSWGYSVPNWITWQKKMLSMYKNIFSPITSAQIISPLGDSDIDPASGQTVSQIVGSWAVTQGMGIGQQGLNNTPGYKNGQAVRLAQTIHTQYPNAYVQFQTVSPVGNAADMQGDIAIADYATAFSIEWYPQDSATSSFQQYFAQWQQLVDTRTGTIPFPTPSISMTPTITVTNTPTPSVVFSITPTPTGMQTPTPTLVANTTILMITVCPHGLGNCGDNANPSGGNKQPLHPKRNITLSLYDLQNIPSSPPIQGTITFIPSAGNFQGSLDAGFLSSGDYIMKLASDGFLLSRYPQVIHVVSSQTNVLPPLPLVAGNINNDTQLDILDYNALTNCFGEKQQTASCKYPPVPQSSTIIGTAGTDIADDDGNTDGIDYNLLIREISVQKGQ